MPLTSLLAGERVLAFAREDAGYVPLMILVAFIPEPSLGFAKWVL